MELEKILTVFYTPEAGLVLDGVGPSIEDEMSAGPIRAELLWGPEECPGHGIWIWEGYPKFFPDEECGQYEFIGGMWRVPTEEEWLHFRLTNTFELPNFAEEIFVLTDEQLIETREVR